MRTWLAVNIFGFDIEVWKLLLGALAAVGSAVAWYFTYRRGNSEPAPRERLAEERFRQEINVNVGLDPNYRLPAAPSFAQPQSLDSALLYARECAKLVELALQRGDIATAKRLLRTAHSEVERYDTDHSEQDS